MIWCAFTSGCLSIFAVSAFAAGRYGWAAINAVFAAFSLWRAFTLRDMAEA